MAEPGRGARFRDEIHRTRRHVGRFGMLVGYARREFIVAQEPTRKQFAVVAFRGVRPFLPGIAAIKAVAAKIIVVGRSRIVWAIGVEPVVALVWFESTFCDGDSYRRLRVDAEPFHSLRVGDHVGLPDDDRAHAKRAKMIAKSRRADPQRKPVPRCSVRTAVSAGV